MASSNSTYNDRIAYENETVLPKPQLEIIVSGDSVFKPGMKAYFIEDYSEGDTDYQAKVMGSYCTCDTVAVGSTQVCTCNSVCTCEAVCTCESNCTCHGYSIPSGNSSSGGTRSCGAPCACVPVH